ncbi:oxysterol-binding protein-related protein 1-like isoform X2 [Varroa destructor]|uniref:Oxysterol-binding protein n=1 Tax=Varroa destructor TaxID=109461 RepID=A0A7M7MI90_VARDE|nr:oxysterol-binding protein-related protein 1-like isoform X2 [Varroa destructor]
MKKTTVVPKERRTLNDSNREELEGSYCKMSINNNPSKQPPPGKTRWGRDRLPHKQTANGFSLWSILKKCFGRELYKVAMPVEFNEPLSFLQRMTETFEYAGLLERAATKDDPVERMQLVSAFAIAALSSNLDRLKKPFNPLLAETYELDRTKHEDGFRVVCEQVSHHPPISAFHGESVKGTYVVEGCVNPRIKFWGRSVEIRPEGSVRVRFPQRKNEEYVWTNVNCCIHNIIIGTLYFEQYGDQVITCEQTELQCRINYKAANGPTDIQLHSILGYIINKAGQKVAKISGRWCHEVYTYSMAAEGGEPLWQVTPRSPHSSDYFNFTDMAMALNEMPKITAHRMPPTDSRYRPDIRLLEQGDLNGAASEKQRLEEKQREARKRRGKDADWKPLWFEKVTDTYWRYVGGYWDRPADMRLPDIF